MSKNQAIVNAYISGNIVRGGNSKLAWKQ